jgi:hypothetical protein
MSSDPGAEHPASEGDQESLIGIHTRRGTVVRNGGLQGPLTKAVGALWPSPGDERRPEGGALEAPNVDQERTPATSRTGRAAGWLSLQEQDGPAEEQGPVQARLGDPERPAPQEDGAFAPGSGIARTAQRLDMRPEWLIERERLQQPARASPFVAGQQGVRRERNLPTGDGGGEARSRLRPALREEIRGSRAAEDQRPKMEPAVQPPRKTRRQDLPSPGYGHGPPGGNSFGAPVQQPNIEPQRQEFQGPPKTREEDTPVHSSPTLYRPPQPLPAATQGGPASYAQGSGSATASQDGPANYAQGPASAAATSWGANQTAPQVNNGGYPTWQHPHEHGRQQPGFHVPAGMATAGGYQYYPPGAPWMAHGPAGAAPFAGAPMMGPYGLPPTY